MQSRRATAAALLLAVGIAVAGVAAPSASAAGRETSAFCDVDPDAWYGDAAAWAKSVGITTGVSATDFDPTGTTSRGQVVTMLHRYLAWRDGAPPPTGEHRFVDVEPDAYYATPVAWAAAAGVTTGVAPDRFAPDGPTDRAQIATLLHRLEARAPVPTDTFDDVPAGSWFDEPAHWMWHEGITTGTAAGRFSPLTLSTRAELVTFLWRLEGRPATGAIEPAPCPRRYLLR